jgi:hypothetical protein
MAMRVWKTLVLLWATLAIITLSGTAFASSQRPVFLHFFDWFKHPAWLEKTFVDPPDWSAIGTSLAERDTRSFYEKQFRYIGHIGVDSLAWEYSAQVGGPMTSPSPVAIAALQESGLRIAPMYDLEISLQVYQHRAKPRPEMATPGLIAANRATTDMICRDLAEFYQRIPASLVGTDENGNTIAFVFGFGFNDDDVGVATWDSFADRLDACLTLVMGRCRRACGGNWRDAIFDMLTLSLHAARSMH